jgi:hypothetical protein
MTQEDQTTEMENGEENTPDVGVDLSEPDKVAFDALVDEFGEELVISDIQGVVKERVRSLYDNRDEVRQRIAQSQQQAVPQ